MKTARLKGDTDFDELLRSRSAQALTMVLKPGDSTGDVMNEHPWAEQWLFVVSGSGTVRTPDRKIKIQEGSLVLIEKRERHQVVNTGRSPLVTLNVYVPIAYDREGEPKPPARRRKGGK